MKKNNMMRGIWALAYVSLMEFKNRIKRIFTHPIEMIGTILKVIIPFTFLITASRMLIVSNGGGVIETIFTYMPVANAAVMVALGNVNTFV